MPAVLQALLCLKQRGRFPKRYGSNGQIFDETFNWLENKNSEGHNLSISVKTRIVWNGRVGIEFKIYFKYTYQFPIASYHHNKKTIQGNSKHGKPLSMLWKTVRIQFVITEI